MAAMVLWHALPYKGKGIQAIPYVWKRQAEGDTLLAAVEEVVWAEQDDSFQQLRDLVAGAIMIVDALLGTGTSRPIGGSLADLLGAVHEALGQHRRWQPSRLDPARPSSRLRPVVVACDCPSGLFCDTGEIDPLALVAEHTVTFALPKQGLFLQPGAAACGQITICDIHIDRSLAPATAPDLLTGEEVAALLPARTPAAHKGTFGTALIVAGSASFPGAAAITSLAAYRAGAGLVRLAAAAAVGHIVAGQLPEPVHTVLPSDFGALMATAVSILRPYLKDSDALLVGPGLGAEETTVAFVEALLLGRAPAKPTIGFRSELQPPSVKQDELPPLVVDADALNALAQIDGGPASLPPSSILTPHPGEMARLTGLTIQEINGDRWQIARRFAIEWRQIVILKGAFTAIAHPDGTLAVSPFAEPALATAGSGDVLGGCIASLLAQGLQPWEAARAGVYVHALAGRLAAEAIGPALLATDIARFLPAALRALGSG